MFGAPMQTHHDVGVGLGKAQTLDASHQCVERLMTNAGFMGQIRKVFEGQAQRSKDVNGARMGG